MNFLRFATHTFETQVAESATQSFISDNRANVKGLILAGSAGFKAELAKSALFDPRLKGVVLKIVDVAYGGDNGFNQAIELSKEVLKNVKLVQEKKIIGTFMKEVL